MFEDETRVTQKPCIIKSMSFEGEQQKIRHNGSRKKFSMYISMIWPEQKDCWLTGIHLPKRAPYLNSNEKKVNQKIKSDVCANRLYTSIEEQKDAISEYIDKRFGRWYNDICDDT